MRVLLIILSCAVVVGIVVFVVVNAPVTPHNQDIVVARIELDQPSHPVLESDPAADQILNFFPEASQLIPATPEPAASTPDQPAEERPKVNNNNADMSRLLAMIEDWVYISFSQISKTKIGQIQRSRENEIFEVVEGNTLENGIFVAQLTDEAATLKLGEAFFNLRLAREPDFFKDIQKNPRPLTPKEQKEAYEYYKRRFGDKFTYHSQGYTPPPGMQMPKPMTPEEYQEGLKKYEESYGKRFREEAKRSNLSYPMPSEQLENYKKYWQQFHPGKTMPPFQAGENSMQNQLGPGNRMQPTVPSR